MNAGARLVLVGVLSAIVAGAGGYYFGVTSVVAERQVDLHEAKVARAEAEAVLKKALGATLQPEAGATVQAGTSEGELVLTEGGAAGSASIRSILEAPGPMGRWKRMMDLATTGDEAAVSAALEELDELPVGIDTIVGKFFLYSRYADREPVTALEALADLPEDELDLARASILGGWAGRAPEEAAAYLMRQVDAEGRLEGVNGRMIESVVSEWTRRDPEAAYAWCLKLEGEARSQALGALVEKWAFKEPSAAALAMEKLPPGEARKDAFQNVAKRWAETDYEAALTWAEKLPAEERTPAIGKAVEKWSEEAPKAAAAYLEGMAAGETRDAAMRQTAVGWAKVEPEEAAGWVLKQPDNDAQRKAMRDVMGLWVKEDSLAASEWLTRQPQGPSTDSAIVSLANAVSSDDPEGAAIWSSTISNPITRALQMKYVAKSWLKSDAAAARAWIESAQMDEEMRKELLGAAAQR